MNTIDIVLGLLFLLAFSIGFRKGLISTLASLIGLFFGVILALRFSSYVEEYLYRWFDWGYDITRLVAFLLTFFLVLIAFSILEKILTKAINFIMLGWANKIFGGVFNVIKYAFLISVVIMYVGSTDGYTMLTAKQKKGSLLYKPVAAIAPAVLPEITSSVKKLNKEINPIEIKEE